MFSLSEWQVSSSILEEERGGATPWKPGRGKVLEEDEEEEDGPGESNRGRVGVGGGSEATVRTRGPKEDKGKTKDGDKSLKWIRMNERDRCRKGKDHGRRQMNTYGR